MDGSAVDWGLLSCALAGGAVGAGLYYLHLQNHQTESAQRTRRGRLSAYLVVVLLGSVVGSLALFASRALAAAFSSWDWVVAALVGAALAGAYIAISYSGRPRYGQSVPFAVGAILAGTGLGVVVLALSLRFGWSVPQRDWIAVAALGACVGVGELVSRYRDAPMLAIITVPGLLYVSINAGAAVAALALAGTLGWSVAPPDGATDATVHWPEVLAAGLGAMTILRSAVFTIRTRDKEDVGVGPSSFLHTILDATDTAVDRARSRDRAWTVARVMEQLFTPRTSTTSMTSIVPAGLSPILSGAAGPPPADNGATSPRPSEEEINKVALKIASGSLATALPYYVTTLRQNLDSEDQKKLDDSVTKLMEKKDLSDRVRLLSLGLLAMNVVGPNVLEAAVASLADDIKTTAQETAALAAQAAKSAGTTAEATQRAKDAAEETVAATETPGTPPEVKDAAAGTLQATAESAEAAGVTQEEAEAAARTAASLTNLTAPAPQIPTATQRAMTVEGTDGKNGKP